ncbi:MAG: TetR/AcrR family transcriptional regulator [bacterium]|nr:TetR/AcrR family transcriptional regulator [bacterium]
MEIDNQKLQQIYSIAKTMFMRHGFKRVSIEEICREASVSKMTFYKFFANKFDLLKFILEKITSETMAEYRDILKQNIPYAEKVTQMIQMKMKYADEISQEFFNDLYKNAEPELVEFWQQKTQEIMQLVLEDLKAAQVQGDVRAEIKPEFILYFLNHLFEMVKDDRLLQLYDSPQALISELTRFFFYGILPR